VLRLTAASQIGKAIAHALGLSEKTVSTYRVRLRKKPGAPNTAELVRHTERYGSI
jgi:DNA-binding CsgD family transcriptional regulator